MHRGLDHEKTIVGNCGKFVQKPSKTTSFPKPFNNHKPLNLNHLTEVSTTDEQVVDKFGGIKLPKIVPTWLIFTIEVGISPETDSVSHELSPLLQSHLNRVCS